jgi:hypothetical protein
LACGKQPIERIVPGELGKVADARGVFGQDVQQISPCSRSGPRTYPE